MRATKARPIHRIALRRVHTPALAQMKQEEKFSFKNARGFELQAVSYQPDTAPKALLIWHHGLAEHSARYSPGGACRAELRASSAPRGPRARRAACNRITPRPRPAVFTRLAEAGIGVCSFDCEAHGTSEPADKALRAVVWSFEHLVRRRLPAAVPWGCGGCVGSVGAAKQGSCGRC
jgi:alpha-beta hydrolase superfamily lysophospholipase